MMSWALKRRVRSTRLVLAISVVLFVVQVHFVPLHMMLEKEASTIPESGLQDSSLSRAASRVVRYAADGSPYVITTTGTYAYQSYVRNFGCSLATNGNHSALLLTFDKELYQTSLPKNLVPFLFDSSPKKLYLRYDTEEFNSFTRRKFEAVVAVLQAGFDVLFADADTVWCDSRTPSEIADSAANKSAHLIFQHPVLESQALNTGLYYARADRNTVEFLKTASRFPGGNDQVAANNLACHHENGGLRVRLNKNEYCIWNNATTIGVLDAHRYPIGCTKFAGRQFKLLPSSDADAMCKNGTLGLVHYSCYRDNAKLTYMKKNKMWHVQGLDGGCTISKHTN